MIKNAHLPILALLAFPLSLSAQEATSLTPPANLETSNAPQVLTYNMEVGKTYDIDMTADQKMAMMGQAIDTSIIMGMKMVVEEGGAEAPKKVLTSYTRTGIDMNAMGQSMSYDSSDESSTDSPLAAMGALVGKEFTMLLDENSKVTAVQGLEELKAGFSGNPVMAGQMDTFLNEDQLKQMSNEWIAQVLPTEAVKSGDTWPFSYGMTSSQVGTITYKGNGTLLGYTTIDGVEVAVIDLDGQIDMDLTQGEVAGPMAAMGMSIGGGETRSLIYWDNVLGYLRKSDTDQTMTMTMKNPQTGEELAMPIRQIVEMHVDVK